MFRHHCAAFRHRGILGAARKRLQVKLVESALHLLEDDVEDCPYRPLTPQIAQRFENGPTVGFLGRSKAPPELAEVLASGFGRRSLLLFAEDRQGLPLLSQGGDPGSEACDLIRLQQTSRKPR